MLIHLAAMAHTHVRSLSLSLQSSYSTKQALMVDSHRVQARQELQHTSPPFSS